MVEVIAIVDWASEYNRLSNHPIPEIPEYLTVPYYGSKWAPRSDPITTSEF